MRATRSKVILGCLLFSLVFAGWYNPKRASADTTINVCGVVSAYVAPTVLTPGVVTINLIPIPILFGANIQGSGLLTVGANVCASFNLNPAGLATSGAVTLNATTQVTACGQVTAYQAATASTAGSITIGGVTFPIAAGVGISGANQVVIGVEACLSATLNATVTPNGLST